MTRTSALTFVLALLCSPAATQSLLRPATNTQFPWLQSSVLTSTVDRNFVTSADMDGDGWPDLVVAEPFNARGTVLGIYFNDGTGLFEERNNPAFQRDPSRQPNVRHVSIGDVDGDGDLDIFAATDNGNDRPEDDLLFLNDGTGFMADVSATALLGSATAGFDSALADLDGDGSLDIVVVDDSNVLVQRNLGGGTFAATPTQVLTLSAPGVTVSSLSVADLDADGDLDVAAFGRFDIKLFFNDGLGTLAEDPGRTVAPPPHPILDTALADVDGDGDPDLFAAVGRRAVSGNQSVVWANDGTGRFQVIPGALPTDSESDVALLEDFDGDGLPDVLVRSQILQNDGSGRFSNVLGTLPEPPRSIVAVDGDGDGDLDLLAEVQYLINDGSNNWVVEQPARFPGTVEADRAFGDLDGDGDLDVLASRSSRQAHTLWRNDGRGYFNAEVFPSSLEFRSIMTFVLHDVDGDNDLDVYEVNNNSQDRLYLNEPSGFVDVTATHLPAVASGRAIWAKFADVDGDGDEDLFVGGNPSIRLYLGDGSGRFTASGPQPFESLPTAGDAGDAGDVDGDGDVDLVVAGTGSFPPVQNLLYLNDGSGGFVDATSQIANVSGKTEAVALLDVDGDGDLDLFAGNELQDHLFENDGACVFTDVTSATLPPESFAARELGVADFDEDGDLDILIAVQSFSTSDAYLLANDGAGVFTIGPAIRAKASLEPICIGDLDGDGDTDAMFSDDTVFLNRLVHLSTPRLPILGRRFEVAIELRTGPPSTLVVPAISTGSAVLRFPRIGTLGLDPAQLVFGPTLATSQSMALWSFTVPTDPGLLGTTLNSQALCFLGGGVLRLTNTEADLVSH